MIPEQLLDEEERIAKAVKREQEAYAEELAVENEIERNREER